MNLWVKASVLGIAILLILQGKLSNIVEFELIPLLEEYWFDEPETIQEWSSKLRGSIQ